MNHIFENTQKMVLFYYLILLKALINDIHSYRQSTSYHFLETNKLYLSAQIQFSDRYGLLLSTLQLKKFKFKSFFLHYIMHVTIILYI